MPQTLQELNAFSLPLDLIEIPVLAGVWEIIFNRLETCFMANERPLSSCRST